MLGSGEVATREEGEEERARAVPLAAVAFKRQTKPSTRDTVVGLRTPAVLPGILVVAVGGLRAVSSAEGAITVGGTGEVITTQFHWRLLPHRHQHMHLRRRLYKLLATRQA